MVAIFSGARTYPRNRRHNQSVTALLTTPGCFPEFTSLTIVHCNCALALGNFLVTIPCCFVVLAQEIQTLLI